MDPAFKELCHPCFNGGLPVSDWGHTGSSSALSLLIPSSHRAELTKAREVGAGFQAVGGGSQLLPGGLPGPQAPGLLTVQPYPPPSWKRPGRGWSGAILLLSQPPHQNPSNRPTPSHWPSCPLSWEVSAASPLPGHSSCPLFLGWTVPARLPHATTQIHLLHSAQQWSGRRSWFHKRTRQVVLLKSRAFWVKGLDHRRGHTLLPGSVSSASPGRTLSLNCVLHKQRDCTSAFGILKAWEKVDIL